MNLRVRIGECYQSFMVAAKKLDYALIKPKRAKKVLKSTGNRLGLGLETLQLWFPLCSRSLNRGSLNFDLFTIKVVGQTI